MNGKVLMLAIIFLGGFHVFYVFNRVQNFANIMYRLCAIQLGECPIFEIVRKFYDFLSVAFRTLVLLFTRRMGSEMGVVKFLALKVFSSRVKFSKPYT